MELCLLTVLSVSPPDFDANNIFKAFFGGPGGFSFEGNLYLCDTKKPYKFCPFFNSCEKSRASDLFIFQRLDQEISSSSLANWRTCLPKPFSHQDLSTMPTPQPTIHS